MRNKKLEAKNITVSFNDKTIIKDISVSLFEGETIGLLGLSGSGKTTFFNVLAGLIAPNSGEVLLDDEVITLQSGKLSYMLQKDLLFPFKTVMDNIILPLRIKRTPKKKAVKTALQFFEKFGLAGTENKYPFEISGGMRQRAALLRTYLSSVNNVILLDEPFCSLDAFTKQTMYEWYMDIADKMMLSSILISHDPDEAVTLCDRIYILAGSPSQIKTEIQIDRTKHMQNYKNIILKAIKDS